MFTLNQLCSQFKIVPLLKKFNEKEIKKKIDKEEKEIREKVFLLASVMIDVHGYAKDEAFDKALNIAWSWWDNGGRYPRKHS